MSKPDLVFITKQNEAKVKAFVERGAGKKCEACGFTITGPHDCPGKQVDEVKTDDADANAV